MTASTAAVRAQLSRLARRIGGRLSAARAPRTALAGISAVVALSLSTMSGTAALWTGSVTVDVPTVQAGSVTAELSDFSNLNHTYTADALSKTGFMTVSNSGSVAADYVFTLTTAAGSSTTMAEQVTVDFWLTGSSASCTDTAAVGAYGWSGPLASAPPFTGSFPANYTGALCVRTRLAAAMLASTATVHPHVSMQLTVPGTTWSDSASSSATQNVVADGPLGNDYTDAVLADGATHFWRLGESSGQVFYDWAGTDDAYAGTGVSRGTAGALVGDTDTATTFPNDATGMAGTRTAAPASNSLSVEAWFKTTSTTGGKIVGFGNQSSGLSSSYDRHLYLDAAGLVHFGTYPGTQSRLATTTPYNDGQWHHVVGSLGAGGQHLYVDGVLVASNTTTTGQSYSGYWRIGGDTPWTGDAYFDGDIDDVAVYAAPLGARAVENHWNLSGRGAFPATAADPYGSTVYEDSPGLFWRLGETGGATVAADSSGAGNTGIYSGNVTKPVPGAIPGTRDTAASFNGTDGVVSSSALVTNPQVFTLELWFNTTSTTGGKLIGFGNAQTGSSTSYDRHIYLQNDGKLVFGVYNAGIHTAVSTASYNDGAWHQVVATLDTNFGMRLYVDGAIVAYNTDNEAAQAYNGYWRVGGDNLSGWPGVPTTSHVTARIDEVAVYGTSLTETQVKERWAEVTGDPIASYTSAADQLTVSFDGSGSYDLDGTITGYAWTFGDGATATGPTASHTYGASNVYIASLTVTDDSGATSTSVWYVVAWDTIAPSTPTALSVTGRTPTSVSLSWAPSTDNIGVTAYQVRRSDGATFSTTATSYTNTGLTSGTSYTYQVRARDAAGNWSTLSTSATTTTLTPTFASTTWYSVRNVASSKCVQGSGTANGSTLVQAACAAGTSQNFRFIAVGSNWRVEFRNAPTMVWDVSGGTTALSPGAPVHLWTYNGATNQQWQVTQHGNGSYSFRAGHSGLCLQFAGGVITDGAQLEQATCNTASNTQRFTLAVAP